MIIHLTNSTIAGAAAMLSAAQRRYGYESICIQFSDSKPERQVFSPGVIDAGFNRDWRMMLRGALATAKIIHVHNWLPGAVEQLVLEEVSKSTAQLVWHLHQGELEHPVYSAREPYSVQWDKKFVVAHAFARTFDDFTAMPNCVFREPADLVASVFRAQRAKLADKGNSPLRVLFSPSSRRVSRWGGKTNQQFDELMEAVRVAPIFSLKLAEGVTPMALLLQRLVQDVSVDEVLTGGFHLVSYEGLFAGTAVINNADPLSFEIFMAALEAPEPPPFVRSNVSNLFETLLGLHQDRELLAQIQSRSADYFSRYMNAERIVSLYQAAYEQ